MPLPSKLWRSMALFVHFSEAKPRSVDRSRGLSWFIVHEQGHVSPYKWRIISVHGQVIG
jgi:hypothetical protein